jgi:hypothetical protein
MLQKQACFAQEEGLKKRCHSDCSRDGLRKGRLAIGNSVQTVKLAKVFTLGWLVI